MKFASFCVIFTLALAGCAQKSVSDGYTERSKNPRNPAGHLVFPNGSPFSLVDPDGFLRKDPRGSARLLLAACEGSGDGVGIFGNHQETFRNTSRQPDFNLKNLGFDRLWVIDSKGNETELQFVAPFTNGFPYGVWRASGTEIELNMNRGNNVMTLESKQSNENKCGFLINLIASGSGN